MIIFCSRSNHRRPANIDIFDNQVILPPGRYRGFEWIKIDCQQIDGHDSVRQHRSFMLRITPDRQKAAMDFRMQRLHPSIHHFRKSRQIGNISYWQSGRRNRFRRPTRGHKRDAQRMQARRKFNETRFIRHGQKRPANCSEILRHFTFQQARATFQISRDLPDRNSNGLSATAGNTQSRPESSAWPS